MRKKEIEDSLVAVADEIERQVASHSFILFGTGVDLYWLFISTSTCRSEIN